LSVLHITVSLLRLYFDLCLFSCLFTLIVVFVIYCFVLPNVANKDLHISLICTTYLGVRSHMECIKLLLQFIRFEHFRSLLRIKNEITDFNDANNSEILENNVRLDIIRIT